MSDEERPDQERADSEPSNEKQPEDAPRDEDALFSSSADSSKEDPTASKWAYGKGLQSRPSRLRLPALPSLSGIRLPKLPTNWPKVPESWPKLPGGTASWIVGAGLFVVVLLIYGVVAGLMGGGAPSARSVTPPPAASASPPPARQVRACEQPSMIATVAGKRLAARKEPDQSAKVVKTYGRKSVLGAPQVFLIEGQAQGPAGDLWYEVLLPMRPNGTTAFVPATDVSVSKTLYRLKVVRNKFSVYFYEGCELVDRFKVGIGNGATPTPVGNFYLQALYKLPNPNTVYGTYAYALSGYSEAIKQWQGGDCAGVSAAEAREGKCGGIIGLHGTNDPDGSIGRYVSNGCIRMRNKDIESMVPMLPLGTPIEIT